MVSDDFNRADNADLGANWTPVVGSCEIVSRTGVVNAGVRGASGGGYDWEVWTANTWNAAQSSQITLRTGFVDCGPIVLAEDAGGADGYMAMAHESLGMRIYRRDDGAFTLISTIGGTVSAGDTIKLDFDGTDTLDYIRNGASAGTVTDSTYASNGGSAGIYCTDQHNVSVMDPELDDWIGTGEVAGGTTENPSPITVAASVVGPALNLSQAGIAFGSASGVAAPAATLANAAGSVTFSGTVGAPDHATSIAQAPVTAASAVGGQTTTITWEPLASGEGETITMTLTPHIHDVPLNPFPPTTSLSFAPDPVEATFSIPTAVVGRAEFPDPVTGTFAAQGITTVLSSAPAAVGVSGGIVTPASSMVVTMSPVTGVFAVPAVTVAAVNTSAGGGWAAAGQAYVAGAVAGQGYVSGAVAGEVS